MDQLPGTKEKDKGTWKRTSKRVLRIFRSRPETPSKSSESDRPERASGDQRDVTVVHNSTGNQDSVSATHGQSKADQHPSARPCQAPPDSKASSMSGTCNEQLYQPLQEQVKQAPPRLYAEDLWKRAAESLDPDDREKLDTLIKSKVKGQSADSPPKGQGGSSHPDGHEEGASADKASLILSRAKRLEDKEATWKPVLNKIINGVLKCKSLGDAVVKFDKSGYAALGWSVVSFGLQVAANAKEAREFVLSSVEVITGFMARYMEYEKWFRGQHAGAEFDHLLTNVYKAILLYVMAMDHYLRQCGAEHLASAIYELDGRSISQRKKAIIDADAEVRDWLLIIVFKSNDNNFSQLRKMINQNLPGPSQQLQGCLRSLSFLEMEDRYDDIEPAAKGICKWLFQREEYRDWAACDRSLLWIKGKPGSGKSTLLRYALDDTIIKSNVQDNTLALSFFFHGRGVELQKTRLGLFRSLLHQLLDHVPDALPELVATFQKQCKEKGEHGKNWQWSRSRLRQFFELSLPKVLENRSVWLFIDALDECECEKAAVELIRDFKTLLRELPPTSLEFRICFTCRHFPILDGNSKLEICVERENNQDISTYIIAQLSTSPKLTVSTVPALITERASGVFMWARLVVEEVLRLEREGTPLKMFEDKVNAIPLELEELYKKLVQDIPEVERPTSLKLIQWICFAMQPLSLDELRWAMIVDADCPHKSLEQCKNAKEYVSDNDMMERQLKTLSHGLAEAVSLPSGQFVQFIHQSVKDFFVEKGLSTLGGNLKSTGTEPDLVGIAHYQLSRTCIRYLEMEEIGQLTIRVRDDWRSEFPLLYYATTSWVSHVSQSEERKVPQDDLLDFFHWPSENLLQSWVRIYCQIGPYSSNCPPEKTSMVHIASRYKWVGLLRVMIQEADQDNVNIDAVDNYCRTPLSWAAENGHEAAVKLLLDTGKAEINLKDDYSSRTPLSFAAENGHEAVVKLILNTGKAEINLKDRNNRTPLLWAAKNGHEAVVKLLLDIGKTEIDSKDYYGSRTPLSWAAGNGHEVIVKLLLDTGKTEVDSKDHVNRTPLSCAAECGEEAVVKLLLDTGKAEINLTDEEVEMPLLIATAHGHQGVVQLLQNHANNNVRTAFAMPHLQDSMVELATE